MRRLSIAAIIAILLTPALSAQAQDSDGISSSAISRCAGKLGLDTRQHDAAFGVLMIDGMPWVTIERTEEKMGTQMIATTVTGTGERRRRDGTAVPFRFTCLLDPKGQAVMFHLGHVAPSLGDTLPPAIIIAGSATYLQRMALPQGAELRVQLLDIAKRPGGDILAEQVVRSGWQVPIPFALRLPKDTAMEGRKLVLAARLVAGRQILFQLPQPRPIGGNDFQSPIELTLEQGGPAGKR